MGEIVFLLLSIICIGLIFVAHKYFGKEEFYFLAVIYAVVAFVMSFKTIQILGVNVNANVIFDTGIIFILYYFVNRYNYKDSKKLMLTVLICVLITSMFLITTSIMVPSLYDRFSISYQNMLLDSLPIIIIYPISLLITMILSGYCFRELKEEKSSRFIKMLFTVIGIAFIETCIFVYFSYAILIDFRKALLIALDCCLVKIILMVVFVMLTNKIFKVKKVKQ